VMPAVGMSLVIVAIFYGLGIFDDFWRDTMGWLSGGHYAQTTIISPWSTFHDEWEKTLLPLFLSNIQYPIKAIFIPRLFIALLLAAIFILPMPVLGWALAKTFGALGKIFVVNVQDNESENKAALVVSDSVWVLWAFSAIAMTVSTFTYATSMHIASNSGLVYLLAFSGLAFCARACQKKVKFIEPLFQTALSCCYILVFIGVCIGCWMHFAYGYWLPAFRPMAGRTLFIDGQQKAVSMLETIDAANLAVAQGKKVMVFYQSPELYLAGDFHNPTRFTLILPYYTSDAQVSEMLKKLEQDPPACVIDDHSLYGLLGDPRFSRYAAQTFGMLRVPGIEAWLNRHYRIASRNPYFTLYQRGW